MARVRHLASASILVFAFASPVAAAPPRERVVALLNLEAQYGVSPEFAASIGDSVSQQVRLSKVFDRVITQKDIEALLGAERVRQMSFCDSEGCVAELAGAVGADFLIRGSLSRIGSNFLLRLTLLDTRRALTVASVERRTDNNENSLLDAVCPATHEVLATTAAPGASMGECPVTRPLAQAPGPVPPPVAYVAPPAPRPVPPPVAASVPPPVAAPRSTPAAEHAPVIPVGQAPAEGGSSRGPWIALALLGGGAGLALIPASLVLGIGSFFVSGIVVGQVTRVNQTAWAAALAGGGGLFASPALLAITCLAIAVLGVFKIFTA
jgi:hypothetical protein